MNRRQFLRSTGLAMAAVGIPSISRALSVPSRELRISRIIIQQAKGRRLTPVAPNAYAAYRGYDNAETILRIQTAQGIEGIAACNPSPEVLKQLLGLDPFQLFSWGPGDVISGASETYQDLLSKLGGADVALVDLLGKAMKSPAYALLGKPVREFVPVYDSSLYMEDLLQGDELKDLPYLNGPVHTDPVERVVRKAEWIVSSRPEKFNTLKIKIGRVKWMDSFEAALDRDIAVTNALREALGPDIRLMVDGNKAYSERPLAAADYAEAVKASNIYFMEEMFPETDTEHLIELKAKLRAAGNSVKLAAGESHSGGIPDEIYSRRVKTPRGEEPLLEVEQADMNAHGFLRLRAKAAKQAALGMTMAPHNFGSKMGFFAQAHLGLVTPNWEISEVDDSQFPALQAEGIMLRDGVVRITGLPGLGVSLKDESLEKPAVDLSA
ncbi:MAG: enolase C-terminal domain-like protein [Verrucomicrobiota bacterium]